MRNSAEWNFEEEEQKLQREEGIFYIKCKNSPCRNKRYNKSEQKLGEVDYLSESSDKLSLSDSNTSQKKQVLFNDDAV